MEAEKTHSITWRSQNPAWETAHRNQLDLESGNHQLYIVNGGHYIWYTNLTQVVQLINEWRMENHF